MARIVYYRDEWGNQDLGHPENSRMTAHCLFEQSGTFRDAFRDLGVPAIDYDIRNDYGKTDVVVDLFQEITHRIENRECSQMSLFEESSTPPKIFSTIFDDIQPEDIVMAFFPCTYFMDYDALNSRCDNGAMRGYSLQDKMAYTIERSRCRHRNYTLLSQLVMIACETGFRLVIENPSHGFLHSYWPLRPALVDHDRRENGDKFKKPTQYFFVNCEPRHAQLPEKVEAVTAKRVEDADKRWERSEIHPQYARRFILQHIMGTDVTG